MCGFRNVQPFKKGANVDGADTNDQTIGTITRTITRTINRTVNTLSDLRLPMKGGTD